MENNAMCSDNLKDCKARVAADLKDALLQAEGVSLHWQEQKGAMEPTIVVAEVPDARITYPWNPLGAEAEAFFAEAEADSIFAGLADTEVTERADTFFAQIHSIWATSNLQASLSERFAVRVPATLIRAIAERASQVATSSLSLAEQLVQSAQDVLPLLAGWTLEDLGVQARPYAFAMRDGSAQTPEASVRMMDWQELSDVEKAKLSLAVASYALVELKASDLTEIE